MIFNPCVSRVLFFAATVYRKVQANCAGVLTISAVAPEIPDMSQQHQPYHSQVGNISYSLDSAGLLELTSTTPGFKCGPITNFVSSNATSKAAAKEPSAKNSGGNVQANQDPVQSVGAQLHCSHEPEDVGVDLMTPWQTITFYGSLFFQIEMKNDKCAKPAELVLDYSRCSYNASTNTGRQGSAIPCSWSTT
ncbi:hypothetical protein PTTG_12533 [Puccinia triticina 1-1 BBBD Race 1]|uniref:Uncharacterized protein n=2 Tax=Puccinia triticina TaxID=208348 RepID=A0A180GJ12_PUCT1|nr:uncharacterized protein PtA15_8A117 [Puccinia triticina]OAV92429.1 hypothetical protein PTTG_12533 [Puccinia triticina 1-1 BBBD Race 1]WAQ87216.1 hypothetical protein PtA15_8A117 [Puccinia triticina]WAR57064.1 hypothetical protein PtB15_8B108 [Puccinia triticina]